jgi:hypothetical protein
MSTAAVSRSFALSASCGQGDAMRYIRYTPIPFCSKDLRDFYDQRGYEFGTKPDGTWFCCGGDPDWPTVVHERVRNCCWNETHLQDLKCQTELLLNEDRLLKIEDPTELNCFTAKYEYQRDRRQPDGEDTVKKQAICWTRVAESYDGVILIAPFRPAYSDYRPEWTKSWDCASGCVWRPKAVLRSLRPE